jgi:Flp pilus assembly protein TadG
VLIRTTGRPRSRRTGTVLVESAFVYPVLFLLLMIVVLGAVAAFRYQLVAHMAREGSRWAACHGQQYALENGTTAATAQDVYTNAIAPQAGGIRSRDLTYSVTWDTDKKQYHTAISNGKVVNVANTVTVTVSSEFDTVVFGRLTVSSTSVSTIFY